MTMMKQGPYGPPTIDPMLNSNPIDILKRWGYSEDQARWLAGAKGRQEAEDRKQKQKTAKKQARIQAMSPFVTAAANAAGGALGDALKKAINSNGTEEDLNKALRDKLSMPSWGGTQGNGDMSQAPDMLNGGWDGQFDTAYNTPEGSASVPTVDGGWNGDFSLELPAEGADAATVDPAMTTDMTTDGSGVTSDITADGSVDSTMIGDAWDWLASWFA